MPGVVDRLAELTRPDVVSWRAALPVAAGTANRALAVLSGLCRHAELIGARPPGSNPCAGLRRRKSTFKARYLTEAEYRRLGDGLRALAASRPETAALIRFMALTGCRRDEARLLRWDWIEGGRAALPDSKGGPRAIWLAGPARALLAARPRTCGFVFARDEQPVGEAALSNAWGRLRGAAGLDGVRLHDLRHSFASVALGSGETLRTLAGLMGHAELATTEAYAHLAEAPVREAAERMGTFLDKALATRLPGRKRRSSADAEVGRYRVSGMSLADFCAAHGLDPDAFHARLRAVQKAEREALA